MIEGLNRETLRRLYIKEGKSIHTIAKLFGCSLMTVWMKCKKHGIKTRPRGKRILTIKKSVLQRLYVNESKSTITIAKMFGCSQTTIRKRCRKYGISLRASTRVKEIKGLNKKTLAKLYIKEQKSTTQIAKMFGCTHRTIQIRCRKYGIKLRPKGLRVKEIDKSILKKLYIEEGKSLIKIAEMFSCSPMTIWKRCKQYAIKTRSRKVIRGLTRSVLRRLYVKEDKTLREIGKIVGCSRDLVRKRCKQFGIKLRPPGVKRRQEKCTIRFKKGY